MNETRRDFPEFLGGITLSSEADHLFKVHHGDEAQLLPEEQAVSFHHFILQLLFMIHCVHRDIQVTVVFLTTRVRAPANDDWGKLKHMLKDLEGTRGLKLILSAKDISTIKWWIDVSYATYDNCKVHGGEMMSLGKGATTSASSKHKNQAKSSTVNELIAVHDTLPQVLWIKYSIEAQGYQVDCNEVYQDNKSAQLLEINGRFSTGKGMKHIKHRYFFVKDKFDQGDIEIVHSPADALFPED